MAESPSIEHPRLAWLARIGELPRTAAVFVLATLYYALHGLGGPLTRDCGIYLYSGQQMLAGVPPYVSIFDHKAPLALMIAWPAAFLARVVHADDLFLVRVSCVLVGGLAAAALYALGRELLGSRASGLFAALFFLAMPALGRATCWGPHPKTWMLLFQVASLFFALRRRWALAGAAGALAGLIWQPMSVYAAGVWLVAALQSGAERRRALVHAIGGSLAVGALVALYLGASGGLAAAFDGAVVFNVKYLEREPKTLAQHFGLIGRVAMGGFGFWWPVALAGLVAHATRFVSARRAGRSLVERLRVDPWALSLLVFPAPFLWSCVDFQGESDLFVFVPIAAVGFAYALSALVRRFRVPVAVPLLALVACGALPWSGGKRHTPVDEQRQILAQAFAYARRELDLAPDQPLHIETVGAPEALALLHLQSWSRYLFIMNGIDNYIEAREPGGIAGWLSTLHATHADAFLGGVILSRRQGLLLDDFQKHFRLVRSEGWPVFYLRRDEG